MKLLPLLCAAATLLITGCKTCWQHSAPFDFALIGDTPYNADQVTSQFPNVIAELNAAKLEFVVHDGDIKDGASACTDEVFRERLKQFEASRHPFIYTFGDNEWTDCGRAGRDPIEAMQKLRELFTQGDQSLGRHKLKLARQSSDPEHAAFRENVRWSQGRISFICLNVSGSANNFGKPEFAARNAANLDWLKQSFANARTNHHRALMIITQGNLFPERGGTNKTLPGFRDLVQTLEHETISFPGQVVWVNGDSHYFRIDKPLVGTRSKRRVENFTRVETFGHPDVHWLRVTADEHDPNVFTFRPHIVKKNVVHHRGP
jgi:hypothetical protein